MLKAGVGGGQRSCKRGRRIAEERTCFLRRMKRTEDRNSLRERSLKETICECI